MVLPERSSVNNWPSSDENMMPPYVPPSDKEIIEGLEFQDNYEAAYRLTELKKENAVLKGKLTKLEKKVSAYKQDLDNANAVLRQSDKNFEEYMKFVAEKKKLKAGGNHDNRK